MDRYEEMEKIKENLIDMMFEYTKHIINSHKDKEHIEKALLSAKNITFVRHMDDIDKSFLYHHDPYFRRFVETLTHYIISEKEVI